MHELASNWHDVHFGEVSTPADARANPRMRDLVANVDQLRANLEELLNGGGTTVINIGKVQRLPDNMAVVRIHSDVIRALAMALEVRTDSEIVDFGDPELEDAMVSLSDLSKLLPCCEDGSCGKCSAPTSKAKKFESLSRIAKKHLGLTTLASRNSDRLDFKEQSVWSCAAALSAAFDAGKAAA